MSEEPSCHLFLYQGFYHQVFVWGDLVNFGAFRDSVGNQKIEDQLASSECHADGSKVLVKAPHSIQSIDASEYFCLPEDGIRMRNLLLEKLEPHSMRLMTENEKAQLAAIQSFSVSKIAEQKRDRLEKEIDRLATRVGENDDVARKLKRRRADLSETIDAFIAVAEENDQNKSGTAVAISISDYQFF